MTRILVLLVLIGSFSTVLWGQGSACSQYQTWSFSGFAGFDPSQPDYSWAYPIPATHPKDMKLAAHTYSKGR